MSEERHTFSEPRPVPGLELPTWDVDVFRDSVPEPILTLRVDENNLPPRRSKKKKIVWKLPDSIDQVPRFGIEEKKRLMDIFKNVKKERRKSKRGSATGSTGAEDGKSDDDGNEPETTNNTQEENKLASDVQNMNLGTSSNGNNNSNSNSSNNNNSFTPSAPPGIAKAAPPAPPGLAVNGKEGGTKDTPPPPPAPRPDGLSSPPPPGLTPVVASIETIETPNIDEPPLLDQKHLQPKPPPLQTNSPQLEKAPMSAPLPTLDPLPIRPIIQPARFVKYPNGMHPDVFGTEVANLYIGLLQSGQVEELMMYYTLTAQKSLSLKSAKSICQTPLEMKTQLQSLVGCVFAVHGITVQQSLNNLLIVWSGVCQLQGQNHGYCHTIVLNPLPSTTPSTDANSMQYQIQNDALVLLAYE